ncbi:MAG: response regulator [Archangium sp.]|nr:response regulator [Archangium sp.]
MTEQIRVLLVDDEPAVVETTEALLSDEFTVTSASSGEAALAALGCGTFDVICTDFNMPGMTGAELLRRALEAAPHLGSVLVTGYREYSSRTDRVHGSYLLLLKPYDPQALIELVRRAGASARLKQQLRAINPSLARKPA